MKTLFSLILVCFGLVHSSQGYDGFSEIAFDENGFRYMNAQQVRSPIHIDGRLDEEAWQNALFQGQFIQREPIFGKPATEKTHVAVLHDDHYLYIAAKCYDSEPEKIIAREMRRDARMDSDDHFQFVIDTYHDRRNGFYFVVNPNGCQRDASFGDEGKSYNSDWDGIWQCRSQINGQGWFTEIAIPWKTLRFAKADTATWGLNFSRLICRKNEEVFWQPIPRDAGRMGMFRLSMAGSLTGLTELQNGGNFEIEPYLLGGASRDMTTSFTTHQVDDFGIDAKIGLTSNMAVNLTWNTDFAQVEADQERVNLTRFSLYFPEKREFFLDGAEVFNFGNQSISGRGGSGNGLRLFYSRRIGIQEGNQQPIQGGAKLVGKTGRYQIGFLNMQTVKSTGFDGDDEQIDLPANNFTVFRLRREILRRANVGFMLLNKERLNDNHYNRSAGVDVNFPLSDTFVISGAIATTRTPNEWDDGEFIKRNEKNWAGNIELEYNSDKWDLELTHLDIQDNFDAEMGYIRRTGIRNTQGEIVFSPRPKNWPSVRQFRYRLEGEYMTDHSNRMLESEVSGSFGIRFQNSSYVYIGLQREAEFVDEDWEVRPGFLVPMGDYSGLDSYIWYSGDESKDIVPELMLSYGTYFTGKRFMASPELLVMNWDRFQAELSMDFNHVMLPEGSFDARTYGARLYYFFSTKLYLKAYLQWNDDRLDNDGDQISLVNLLFRWTYQPGSDLYLVYNDRRLFGPSDGAIENRTVMLKTTWFWRR